MCAGQESTSKSCLPISATTAAIMPTIEPTPRHSPPHHTHRLTTCKTPRGSQPARLITAAAAKRTSLTSLPLRAEMKASAAAPQKNKKDQTLPVLPSVSVGPPDSLDPINGMSLLIFGTLTCGSPEVALIGMECDNFND